MMPDRKDRWVRKDAHGRRRPWVIGGALLALLLVSGLATYIAGRGASDGPEGFFAEAVYAQFPEADPARIETREEAALPDSVTIHLPAYMIEVPRTSRDPFERLGSEFGSAERSLAGTVMAERIERIARDVLPDDVTRCHTYEVGRISSPPEEPRPTRALHIYLNPGC